MALDADGKVTFYFKDSQQISGWTETLSLVGVTDFTTMNTAALAYAQARVLLLGRGAALTKIRLSNYTQKRQFQILSLAQTPTLWNNPAGAVTARTATESGQDCIQVDCLGELGTHKKLFMAGCPDDIFIQTSQNGIDFSAVSGFAPAFDAWKKLLLVGSTVTGAAPWGFAAKSQAGVGDYKPILDKSRDPLSGNVLILLSGDLHVLMGAGARLQVAGNRRSNAVFRGINGIKISNLASFDAVSGLTSVQLRGTSNADTDHWLEGSFGQVRVLTFTSQKITKITPEQGITRKRGGVFLLRRGRLRSRKLLPS